MIILLLIIIIITIIIIIIEKEEEIKRHRKINHMVACPTFEHVHRKTGKPYVTGEVEIM